MNNHIKKNHITLLYSYIDIFSLKNNKPEIGGNTPLFSLRNFTPVII